MRNILFITGFLISLNLNAQNVSLESLINIRTKPLASVEEFLSAKNWTLLEIKEPDDKNLGIATFAFGKSRYEEKAEAFINYYYLSINDKGVRISLQLNNISSYNDYISKIKSSGFILSSSKIEEGELIKVYNRKGTTIEVKTSKIKNDYTLNTIYILLITSESDYIVNLTDWDKLIEKTKVKNEKKRNDFNSFIEKADSAYLEKNYTEAILYYNQAKSLYIDTLSSLNLKSLANSYYNVADYKNAIINLKQYLLIEDKEDDVYDLLASAYYFSNDIKNAITSELKAIALNDTELIYKGDLSWFYILSQQLSKAEEVLTVVENQQGDFRNDVYYYIKSNSAHLKLVKGLFEDAKKTYLLYKDVQIGEEGTWNQLVIKGLKKLKEKNIKSTQAEQIINLLKK